MKAITLWQPWASLIAEGVKTIETRERRSPWHVGIGQVIAIHAAKLFAATCPDGGACHHSCTPSRGPERSGCYRVDCCGPLSGTIGVGPDEDYWPEFPLGAVVATCTLADVVPIIDQMDPPPEHGRYIEVGSPPFLRRMGGMPAFVDVRDQRPFGDYRPGRWALLLDNVVKLEPIHDVGGHHQGLWTVPTDAALRVVEQLGAIVA